MASKKSEKTKAPAKTVAKPVKAAPKVRAEKTAASKIARHPKARVVEKHGSKEALAKSVAESLAREDQDTAAIIESLKTASNQQLLRLARVADSVKQKYGSRAKMITAIGAVEKKSKDKDFLAKLDTFSLPQLFDLATAAERRARP